VSELAADGIRVAVTCRVLNIARQPYYRWLARPVTGAELAGAYRADALFDAHRDDPEFGYRFLADGARAAGQPMVERTAWRICSQMGWWSAFSRKRRRGRGVGRARRSTTTSSSVTSPPAAANQLWLADITEHRTGEGKLYLCAIKDVWSNRIVGYSIGSRMKSRLAVNALHNAVVRRGDVACCTPTAGRNFRSRKFVRALNQHHVIGSMGRVGAAGDNAAMESFSACCRTTCSTAAPGPPASS
jgi:putative transposase